MDTVMLRSGKVIAILGSNITDAVGKITGYLGVTSNQSGAAHYKDSPWSTYQAVLTTTSGSGTATVNVYGSNDGVNFCNTAIGTITLSGVSGTNDGFTVTAPWKYVKAILTSLTGTGAACYVTQGV